MKTLDQIRAHSALGAKQTVEHALGQSGPGDRLGGFPLRVLQSGLISTLAFAQERRRNNEGWKHPVEHAVAEAVTAHLRAKGVELTQAQNPGALLSELANAGDDRKLRQATVETICFLNYLKRFVA